MADGETGDLRWFVFRVTPQREDMAAKILRLYGFVAARKTERRLRRVTKWDRERKLIEYCAAPGYVFAAFPSSEPFPWHLAFKLHLIKSVVAINGAPAQLNGEAVMRFLNFDDGQLPDYFKHFRTGSEFAIGDEVTVLKGPFAEFKLRVQDVKDGEAIFLLKFLGKETTVRVSVNDCFKAEAA